MALTFGATIRFVSRDTFYKALESVPGGREGLLFDNDWKPYQLQPGQYQGARGMSCCLGGGVTNGTHVAPLHLLPTSDKVTQFESKIEPEMTERVDTFKKASDPPKAPLSAVFMGGHNVDDSGIETVPLFEKVKTVLNRAGIKPSYFLGSKEGGTSNMVYDAQNDTWLVYEYMYHGNIRSMDDLKQRFQHIHIAPGDTVEFEEKAS